MCGVLGIYSDQPVIGELISGLSSLQHRGQDSAGVVTLDQSFHMYKGKGMVSHVFQNAPLDHLRGDLGLGHVRYATQGSTEEQNTQPFTVNYPFGIAMIHNGNLTNFDDLRRTLIKDHYRLIQSNNDIELILYSLVLELEKFNLKEITHKHIFSAVRNLQEKLQGAYAVVSMIAGHGMLAFTDPCNIRPLVLGEKKTEQGTSYALASETTTLDYLGYQCIHQLEKGEMLFIDKEKKLHFDSGEKTRQAFCVFEYIYFAREDSIIHKRLVASERRELGRALAGHFRSLDLRPDIVIDVPSSSYFCAEGLASALEVPYQKGLIKNRHIGRSFILATQELREKIVRQKLNPIRSFIEGKKIAVVDDSIVRGTTSKHIVSLLREKGAKEVYFVSASPPIKYSCPYGIDISNTKEMIASQNSVESVRNFIGADALIYPSIDDLRTIFKKDQHCDACFSSDYPTSITTETLQKMELEKIRAGR